MCPYTHLQGLPPEATVDAAALAEQTGSGSSCGAMRKPCLCKRQPANSGAGRGRDECLRPGRVTWRRQRETSSGQRRTATRQERSPHLEHNQLSEDSVTREEKSQQHSKRCRPRLRSCVQWRPEKAHQSPGGAVSSTRPEVPRDAQSAAAQQRSMSESEETQRRSAQEATDTTHHGLSQRGKSYGSEPRQEARDESSVSIDEEGVSTTQQH